MPWAPALTEQQKRDIPQDSVERVTSAIRMIEPCIGILYDDSRTAPNMFHLLDCGHVVVIDGPDTRCGSNCRYPIDRANPRFSQTVVKSTSHTVANSTSSHPTATGIRATDFWARQDPLYCETCEGIPVDHYHFQKPPKNPGDLRSRRSLALTRGEIVAALQIPDAQVETLLAAPFPNPDLQEHNLHCGHKVYCVAPQPCCQNCEFDKPCLGHPLSLLFHKDPSIIFCQECVLRAERLHIRYEAKAMELELRREGYPELGTPLDF